MKCFIRGIFVFGLVAIAGCATIISGSTQSISFNSTPPGASILINGANMGATPVTMQLSRKESYAVSIQLDGYEPQAINLKRGMNGWVWGNIIFGGLIGLVVDAASGSMYALTPDQVAVSMKQQETSGDQPVAEVKEGKMYLAFTLHPDPSWEKIGQLQPR